MDEDNSRVITAEESGTGMEPAAICSPVSPVTPPPPPPPPPPETTYVEEKVPQESINVSIEQEPEKDGKLPSTEENKDTMTEMMKKDKMSLDKPGANTASSKRKVSLLEYRNRLKKPDVAKKPSDAPTVPTTTAPPPPPPPISVPPITVVSAPPIPSPSISSSSFLSFSSSFLSGGSFSKPPPPPGEITGAQGVKFITYFNGPYM